MENIPVIDVKGLTEKEEDLQQLAAQIKDAFTNIGFVAITNHNVSEDVVSINILKITGFEMNQKLAVVGVEGRGRLDFLKSILIQRTSNLEFRQPLLLDWNLKNLVFEFRWSNL